MDAPTDANTTDANTTDANTTVPMSDLSFSEFFERYKDYDNIRPKASQFTVGVLE